MNNKEIGNNIIDECNNINLPHIYFTLFKDIYITLVIYIIFYINFFHNDK
jgi:hypothetical protein